MADWQTVLYKPRKGKTPWKLKASFVEKLNKAFETLKPQIVEGIPVMPFKAIPIDDIKGNTIPAISKKTSSKSVAQQLGRKYKNTFVVVYSTDTPDIVLLQPKKQGE